MSKVEIISGAVCFSSLILMALPIEISKPWAAVLIAVFAVSFLVNAGCLIFGGSKQE